MKYGHELIGTGIKGRNAFRITFHTFNMVETVRRFDVLGDVLEGTNSCWKVINNIIHGLQS